MKLNSMYIKTQLTNWGVSKTDLARKLHTDVRNLNRWLGTQQVPSSVYLVKLVWLLDCSLDDLVILEDRDKPNLL